MTNLNQDDLNKNKFLVNNIYLYFNEIIIKPSETCCTICVITFGKHSVSPALHFGKSDAKNE